MPAKESALTAGISASYFPARMFIRTLKRTATTKKPAAGRLRLRVR
ncbi:hypothetical protein STHU_00850 [Allostella humosa]|nr:hypothetical protein STHU_00850 [Stella humosa]